MTGDDSIVLPADLHAPGRARAWLSERTTGLARTPLEDALLIVSELVTNAIRHGGPEIVLSMSLDAECVRVGVSDSGDLLPVLPSGLPDLDRPSGRGLMIVAATADEWGVTPIEPGPGKSVWALVRI